jgi:tol-pal system protein YbgF
MIARQGRWAALGCVAVLALGGCASTPPEEDPTQIKLNDIDNRLTKIERVMANQSLLQLANDLEALRAEIKSMRNEVDQLSNRQEAAKKQQRDLYTDLDERLKGLEGRGGTATGASAAGVPAAGVPAASASASSGASSAPARSVAVVPAPDGVVAGDGTDKGDYQAAFSLLKNSQYDRSIAAFKKFLATYPQSPLAENAQYWLGEAYYVNKSYQEALSSFHQVSQKYPQSRKLADALLKTGYCYYELKQWSNAREILTQVADGYPDSSAGRLARQRLDKMSSEKH